MTATSGLPDALAPVKNLPLIPPVRGAAWPLGNFE